MQDGRRCNPAIEDVGNIATKSEAERSEKDRRSVLPI
jgi:hypothetical protein